ncbi:MAG: hypothetical protein IAA81_05590 [Spirochaetes bacterium]|uniref:Uncharacterized protein n=1 Tax=Candidatus Gallitreponema excrementavium TaxID=2840840 RepID=A0A9D9N291_9SPIR|nr:hypothetical protein [Candidatus Gallitreponema excrementavium]
MKKKLLCRDGLLPAFAGLWEAKPILKMPFKRLEYNSMEQAVTARNWPDACIRLLFEIPPHSGSDISASYLILDQKRTDTVLNV